MKRLLLAFVFLSSASVVDAQAPVVTQYQFTRQAPAPVASFVFQKTAMSCGLTRGTPPSTGIRINDPLNDALDCELLGTLGGVLLPVGPTPASYSLRAGDVTGLWSAETVATNLVPPAPPVNPRVRPGALSVSADGVVQPLVTLNGLQIAPVLIGGVVVYFGAPTLTIPAYSVRPGDRFSFAFWKP